jgi:hypothetical protein
MQNHGVDNNNVEPGLDRDNFQMGIAEEGRQRNAPPGNIERNTGLNIVSRITKDLFKKDCLDPVLERHHLSGWYINGHGF